MKRNAVVLLAVAIALPSIAQHRRAVVPPSAPLPTLVANRSFAVTEIVLLDTGFPLKRVLSSIVAGSNTSPEQLIRQMFDTQNPRPGMADAAAPHCDDFLADGVPMFNGFPRRCPTPEAQLAGMPFGPETYRPLALVNRFDMAPADGANCGQYRIVYITVTNNVPGETRLIFEAVLPNPHPEIGIAGCRPVAQFWADLSAVDSQIERRVRLERFFFDGLDGFEPVVRAEHYAPGSGGGIRTRQLTTLPARPGRGYQFHTDRQCASPGGCTMRLMPDVLQNLPFGPMFDASLDTPAARAFREHFLTQIPTLAINDVNRFRMDVDRRFLVGESDPANDLSAFNYSLPFANSQSTAAGKAFRAQIDAELKRIGSKLTPEDVVARAQTQTCNGCHFGPQPIGGGLTFPGASQSHQVTGAVILVAPGEQRWALSPAMDNVFIPNRMRILREFLTSGTPPPEHSN